MKKRLVYTFVALVGSILLAAGALSLYRSHLHAEALVAVEAIVKSVEATPQANVRIEIDPQVRVADFSQAYSVVSYDYTLGFWEFWIEFANGSRYYLDFRIEDDQIEGAIALGPAGQH